MQSGKWIQLVALLACAGLLFAASTRMGAINEGRKQLNMMASTSPIENAPPEYAFAIQALGAFRGLIVDLAFIRAENYKEQGRYYDAMQLADWICKLQPYFPTVWEFHAWNLSWNISVTTYTPEERWKWVYNGVRLLRDEGIPFNRRAINLYKQLAWTFNNKMGEVTDDYHYTYKCNWAWRMHLLLGPPPDPLDLVDPKEIADRITREDEVNEFLEAARRNWLRNEEKRRQAALARGEDYEMRSLDDVIVETDDLAGVTPYMIAKQGAYERLRPILDAPDTLAALYAAVPRTRALVEQLRQIGIALTDDELNEDIYWREGGLAFTFFQPYRELKQSATVLQQVLRDDVRADVIDEDVLALAEEIDRVLKVREGDPAGQALVHWLQRKVLSEVYKLAPEHMAAVVEQFGPVDWRSVDSQSLYWVTKGLIESGDTMQGWRNDKANTARIMFFSLRNLFLRNKITFEPYPEKIHLSYLNFGRDLNFIEPLHQAYIDFGLMYDPKEGEAGQAGDTFRIGHQNFLTEIVRLLYISGRKTEAAHYYRYIQEHYRLDDTGRPNPALAKTLHNYVWDDLMEVMDYPSVREARLALDGLFFAAFEALADGDATRYASQHETAQELYRRYMADKQEKLMASKRLPPFLDVQVDAFAQWFVQRPPTSPNQTLRKIRLWWAAPLYLRQAVYDDLLPLFRNECSQWRFDVTRAFPEPPGMDVYREQKGDRYKDEEDEDPNTITLPQTVDT